MSFFCFCSTVEGKCVCTFGEELGVAPDGPADTGVDEAVLVAGDVD